MDEIWQPWFVLLSLNWPSGTNCANRPRNGSHGTHGQQKGVRYE